MSWGSPWFFGFLALIPLILLLHSLWRKRKEVKITTLFLWEELLQERRATLGISRIVKSLTLLLQILVVIILTVGLAQPFLTLPATREGNIVLILDTSASMQTKGPRGSRFALAQAEARRLIDQLHEKSYMSIIEAGAGPTLKTFFTRDKQRLRNIVDQMEVQDTIGNLREAVLLALSFLQGNKNDEIVLLSDGTETEWQKEIPPRGMKITPILFTEGEKNVGITHFAFRKGWGDVPVYEMMITVHNFTSTPLEVPLEVIWNRKLLLQERVSLQSDEARVLVYPFDQELTGILEARLVLEDDFPVDNVAYTVLTQAQAFWVLLITPGNYFLENLLAAHPQVLVNRIDQIDPAAFEQQIQGHHIVIFDRITPPPLPFGNFLLINTLAPGLPITLLGEVQEPELLDWQRDHPILRQVQLEQLTIRRAQQVELHSGARPIVEATATPLLTTVQRENLRVVHLGFDLLESDLPMRVAFPLLFENIFQWLYPGITNFSSQQIQVGEIFTLPVANNIREVTVRKPEAGRAVTLPVTENPFHFRDTRRTGIYSVKAGNHTMRFAVNLLSEQESRIQPRQIDLTEYAQTDLFTEEEVEKPLWHYFVLAALLFTFGEWYCWCRGR